MTLTNVKPNYLKILYNYVETIQHNLTLITQFNSTLH
jgi:hypothetical protein